MKIDLSFDVSTKYLVRNSSTFNKDLKKVYKQGKDLDKLKRIIIDLANGDILDEKYKDHELSDSKHYKNCRECHIEPDWLLVYRIDNNELILLLIKTGSHSDLF